MKRKVLLLASIACLVIMGLNPSKAQVCPGGNNHLTNGDFAAGLANWGQYGLVNAVVLPINSGCISNCLVMPASNNSNSGVIQQVTLHKDTCYDFCYCIESPNTGGNSKVTVAMVTSAITQAQLLSGSFTPSQAQIIDSYVITGPFAAYQRCPGVVKATGNFTGFVIINETFGPIGSDIRVDNTCLQSRLPCPIDSCSLTLAAFNFSANGLNAQFNDQSTSGYPISGWSWNFGDPASGAANTSTSQNPSHTFTAPGIYTVCLIITAANTSGTLCSDTLCKDVTVSISQPCDSLDANFTYATNGLTGNFTDNSTIPSGATISSWAWDFGDPPSGANNTSSLQNPSHVFTAAGWYIVCLKISIIASDGTLCQDSICKDVFIPGTNPDPCDSLSVWFSSSGTMAMNFNDLSQASGGLIITSWSWTFGDPASGPANTSTLQNPLHNFTAPGTYLVCLTVTAIIPGTTTQCTKKLCREVLVTQGFTDLSPAENYNMQIVPNPNQGLFSVQHNGTRAKAYQIIDLQGRIVQQKDVVSDPLIIGGLKAGAYQLLLFTDKGTLRERFVVK